MGLNLVRDLIDNLNWTREQLAYRVGCTSRSIENWYQGKIKPLKIYREKLERLHKQEKEKRGL